MYNIYYDLNFEIKNFIQKYFITCSMVGFYNFKRKRVDFILKEPSSDNVH